MTRTFLSMFFFLLKWLKNYKKPSFIVSLVKLILPLNAQTKECHEITSLFLSLTKHRNVQSWLNEQVYCNEINDIKSWVLLEEWKKLWKPVGENWMVLTSDDKISNSQAAWSCDEFREWASGLWLLITTTVTDMTDS